VTEQAGAQFCSIPLPSVTRCCQTCSDRTAVFGWDLTASVGPSVLKRTDGTRRRIELARRTAARLTFHRCGGSVWRPAAASPQQSMRLEPRPGGRDRSSNAYGTAASGCQTRSPPESSSGGSGSCAIRRQTMQMSTSRRPIASHLLGRPDSAGIQLPRRSTYRRGWPVLPDFRGNHLRR
jgi:hypothetical protein